MEVRPMANPIVVSDKQPWKILIPILVIVDTIVMSFNELAPENILFESISNPSVKTTLERAVHISNTESPEIQNTVKNKYLFEIIRET